jgi:hypothetical protein
MRHKISVILILIALSVTSIFAGEPHAYLTALANDVTLPAEMGIKMDLVPDLLSYSFRTKSYAIDSLLRNAYPSEIKEVIGPSENGFIIRISVGPKGNLPMSRHDGFIRHVQLQGPIGPSGCTDMRRLKEVLRFWFSKARR